MTQIRYVRRKYAHVRLVTFHFLRQLLVFVEPQRDRINALDHRGQGVQGRS